MLRPSLLLMVALLAHTTQCGTGAACTGPVLYFPFDTNMNSAGCEQAGSEISGDGVSLVSAGVDGGAAQFDGSSLLKVAFLGNYLSQSSVDQFSVSLWAKQDSDASSSAGLVGNSDCSSPSTFGITAGTSQSISSFVATGDSGQEISASTNIKINSDVWTHLALTYDGNTLRTYVDGAQKAVTTRNGSSEPIASSSCSMTIGQAETSSGDQFFKGTMTKVAVFDRALTANDVQAMHQRTFNYQPIFT